MLTIRNHEHIKRVDQEHSSNLMRIEQKVRVKNDDENDMIEEFKVLAVWKRRLTLWLCVFVRLIICIRSTSA